MRPRQTAIPLVLASLGLAASACGAPTRVPPESLSLTARTATVLASTSLQVRVSNSSSPPCSTARTIIVGVIAVGRCAGATASTPPSDDVLALAARVSHAMASHPTPDALHAAALLDLASGDTASPATENPVAYLRAALQLGDSAPATLTDLSAALLVQAGVTRRTRDLIEALDAAAHAIDAQPRDAAARFDAALALSELGLLSEAQRAWAAYLKLDSTSAWAARARLYGRTVADTLSLDASAHARTSLVSLAGTDAQRARIVGWDSILVAWAAAALDGDTANQSRHLRDARRLGHAIVVAHGDASLEQAVQAIARLPATGGATSALARAQLAYADGKRRYDQGDYIGAVGAFARAMRSGATSPALFAWTRLFRGASLIYLGRIGAGRNDVLAVLAGSDPRSQPALAGRARWILGTTLERADHTDAAIDEFQRARRLFAAAGEGENRGAVECLIADAELGIGAREGYAAMKKALDDLLPYRQSVWLHDLLFTAATAAAADGYVEAALSLQREGIAVAAATGEPISIIEARLSLARLLTRAGHPAAALREIDASRRALRGVRPSYARDWLAADLYLTIAQLPDRSMPATDLDTAVRFFTRHAIALQLIPTLVARAELLLAHGRQRDASRDLRQAASLIHQAAAHVRSGPEREALLASTRTTFDQLTKLAVAHGAARQALRFQRLGQEWVGPSRRARSVTPSIGRAGVTLQYALIDDTLYAWTMTSSDTALRRWPLAARTLAADEEALLAAISIRGNTRDVQARLARFFDELVRPILGSLPADHQPLTIVEGPALMLVPFAALWDTATHRYVIQDHSIQYALSAARDDERSAAVRPDTPRVLLIADPAFDQRRDPDLRPLPGSRREIEAIARLYRHTRILIGSHADHAAVSASLTWAQVVHYAGHVEYDDGHPEGSRLVLAAGAGPVQAEDLRPRDIRALDLRHARLVVLSSCRALPSLAGHGQGLANLATSFLDAGARGVVASQWPVDDNGVAQLMIAFHNSYARSRRPADALRKAQLAMIRSASPALRSPSRWAAFQYITR